MSDDWKDHGLTGKRRADGYRCLACLLGDGRLTWCILPADMDYPLASFAQAETAMDYWNAVHPLWPEDVGHA